MIGAKKPVLVVIDEIDGATGENVRTSNPQTTKRRLLIIRIERRFYQSPNTNSNREAKAQTYELILPRTDSCILF